MSAAVAAIEAPRGNGAPGAQVDAAAPPHGRERAAPEAYRVAAFAAPDAEVARLAEQAQLIAAEERAALEAVGLPHQGRGIEIGCGPGFFAAGLRQAHPELALVGMDVDPYVLATARARLPVVRGDGRGGALPLARGAFDLAYSRLFLRHMIDPARALAAMVDLVKPGGTVAAIDSSDASLLLDPMPEGFAAIATARGLWFAARGCSAEVGHRLPGLFTRAGLADVRVRTVVLDTAKIGARAFAQIVLVPFLQAAKPMLDDDAAHAEATAAVWRWAADPTVYGTITIFVVGGRRMAAAGPFEG